MIPPEFSHFVGVDWSGAKGRAHSGIAVAECDAGAGAPALVAPPRARWSRADFVDWVASRADSGDRVLMGIDCAFALPEPAARIWLGETYRAADLWAFIDAQVAEAEDFYGGDFADHADHHALFWRGGKRPAGFVEHHRATEAACRAAGLGMPESPLKLIGARQVGKGGLAGMRVLARLKRRLGDVFRVWPFEPIDDARIVCVELYPRLFMRMAGHGNSKVRTMGALNACLAALGAEPHGVQPTDAIADHDSDALVAAAGLRKIAGAAPPWSPFGLDALARRAEGWIFGVP